jgi:hypothetical protein
MEKNDNNEVYERVRGVLCTIDPNTVIASATTNRKQHSTTPFFLEGSIELYVLRRC